MTRIDSLSAREGDEDLGDSFRLVVSRSLGLLGANGVALVLAVVQGIVLARALGPDKLGRFALITVIVGTVQQFFDSRVWDAGVEFLGRLTETGNLAAG